MQNAGQKFVAVALGLKEYVLDWLMGEAEVLVLARELEADLILLDEEKARKSAVIAGFEIKLKRKAGKIKARISNI